MVENFSEFTLNLEGLEVEDIKNSKKEFIDGSIEKVSIQVLNKIAQSFRDSRDNESESQKRKNIEMLGDVEKLLDDSGKSQYLSEEVKEKAYFVGSNSSPVANLSFIYHVLKNGGSVDDIVNGFTVGDKKAIGLEERYKEQFVTDFVRAGVKVKNQHGEKVFDHSLYGEIRKSLESEGKEIDSYDNIVSKMEEILRLTPQQSRYIITNFNQRNIEGTPTLFSDIEDLGVIHERNSSFYVNVNDQNEIISTDKIIVESIAKKNITKPDGDILGQKDYYSTFYEADISSFKGGSDYKLLLPIYIPKEEKITYKASDSDAAYFLTPELQRKATNLVNAENNLRFSPEIEEMDLPKTPVQELLGRVRNITSSLSMSSSPTNSSPTNSELSVPSVASRAKKVFKSLNMSFSSEDSSPTNSEQNSSRIKTGGKRFFEEVPDLTGVQDSLKGVFNKSSDNFKPKKGKDRAK